MEKTKITKAEFFKRLVNNETANVLPFMNITMEQTEKLEGILNDTLENINDYKPNWEFRKVAQERSNDIIFDNGSHLLKRSNSDYYELGNFIFEIYSTYDRFDETNKYHGMVYYIK